jgi:DNA-binding NarL/FixJ family response regulator
MPATRPKTMTVVVVEDQAMVRDALISGLQAAAFTVASSAESVAGGKAAIEEYQPDVIVTDYHLPDGVGTELAQLVRDSGISSRVLLLSGRGRPSIVDEAISSGCHGFVSKSQPMRDLVDAIQAIGLGATVFPWVPPATGRWRQDRHRSHPDRTRTRNPQLVGIGANRRADCGRTDRHDPHGAQSHPFDTDQASCQLPTGGGHHRGRGRTHRHPRLRRLARGN